MLKKMQIAMALCAVAVSFVAVASASATTTAISPGGRVTATGTTRSILTITQVDAIKSLTCESESATATLRGSTSGVLPHTVSTDVSLFFPDPDVAGSSCRLVGGASVTVTCTRTAILQVTGLTGVVGAGITQGQITNISCAIAFTALPRCGTTVTGLVRGEYSNSTGELRIYTTGQALTSVSNCNTFGTVGASIPADFSADPSGDLLLLVTPNTTITTA